MDVVARTSIAVAAVRAWESGRADRWFDDPHAALLAARAGVEPGEPADPIVRAIARSIVVRTRWIDEALAASPVEQVVLLGAGLDCRAWRLAWPAGTALWELDRAEVLDFKASVVADLPACDRRPVAVDLLADWPADLAGAGHDPSRPTAWVAEGLLVYFDDTDIDRLLRRVTERSCEGSRLLLTLRSGSGIPARLEGVWRSSGPADPAAWLAPYGWAATARRWDDLAAEWGRPAWRSRPARPGLVDAVRRL